jgi:hypothetical protein
MVPLNRKQGTVSAGLNVTLDPSVSDNRGSTIFSVSPILQINQPLLEEMKDKNNQPIRDRQGNPIMKPKRGGVFYGQLGFDRGVGKRSNNNDDCYLDPAAF